MHQAGIGDLGASEVQEIKLRQPFQVHQAGIGDLGGGETQLIGLEIQSGGLGNQCLKLASVLAPC